MLEAPQQMVQIIGDLAGRFTDDAANLRDAQGVFEQKLKQIFAEHIAWDWRKSVEENANPFVLPAALPEIASRNKKGGLPPEDRPT